MQHLMWSWRYTGCIPFKLKPNKTVFTKYLPYYTKLGMWQLFNSLIWLSNNDFIFKKLWLVSRLLTFYVRILRPSYRWENGILAVSWHAGVHRAESDSSWCSEPDCELHSWNVNQYVKQQSFNKPVFALREFCYLRIKVPN